MKRFARGTSDPRAVLGRGPSMTLALVTALLGGTGCGAAPYVDTTPGVSASAGGQDAVEVATVAVVAIRGVAQDPDGRPVPGVAVCMRPDPMVATNARCTTSDGDGSWALTGPANSRLAITSVKTDFVPLLRPIATKATDVTIPPGDGALIAANAGAPLVGGSMAPGSGAVAFSTATPGSVPAAAATVVLGEFDGTTIDDSPTPVYVDAAGQPVPGATFGTEGVFANLAAGTYAMTFRAPSVSCTNAAGLYGYPIAAYAAPGEAIVVVPVVDGFLTAPVVAQCSPFGAAP